MSPRYLIVSGDGADESDLLQLLRARTGLEPGFATPQIAALGGPGCGCLPLGTAGCVLGTLFHRHGPAKPLDRLAAGEEAAILASSGSALTNAYWGGYVAAVAGADAVRVLRDPSGDFPCYHSTLGERVLFASDADLLVDAGASSTGIDFEEIGRTLYRAFVPAPATALSDISELLAGFALRVEGASGLPEPCWSAWDHVASDDVDPAEASERLCRTVRHCVEAWASSAGHVLLGVSGGLDSSIVAACLATAGAKVTCLTMFTDDPSGDERPFARALCEHLRLPLIERPYRLEDIDITEPLAANLPRPRDRTQAVAHERVHHEVAREVGADAFMTGNGGDHVFGYSQSAAPVADRYLSEGLGRGTFEALLDVCRQTGCSMTDAVRQAWRLAREPPGFRVRPNPLFLAPGFVEGLGPSELHHPWLDAPARALPGKAAHIATILRSQPNLEPVGGTEFPVLNPLVSQPIVEACLKVPSWAWRAGGRDRSLARRAFASALPQSILERRVKGTPSRFAARLLDHFREPIRERLLGGRLASERIVDCAELETVLAGERPVSDLQRVRILELVNAEAWIDHWSTRRPHEQPLP